MTEARPFRSQIVVGWIATAMSTALSCLWAFWGSIENFHEGWFYRALWRNVVLGLVQYLPWMFVPMVAALIALWRRAAGVAVHVLLAGLAFWLFSVGRSAGVVLIVLPLLALAIGYAYGRPVPVVWARRALVALPLVTAVASGAYPGWRVLTRPAVVDLSAHRLASNGVDLVWAPAGPGWPDVGFSWFEATRRCGALSADGLSLSSTPPHIWRLPSVDEAVRSQVWRGENAGGHWDPATHEARYRVMPDKEAPLWNRYSPVIYWWTADEVDRDNAYRVVYNGIVNSLPKRIRPGDLAYRCVKDAVEPRPAT
jgi:hypothetical protein